MADKATVLIGYTNLDSGNLVMVANTYGLSTQHVALVRTRHEHDVVLNAKGQLSGVVHPGGNGQVGQGEQSASLTDISSIQMGLRHRHLSNGMLVVQRYDTATGMGCEAVVLIQ